MTPPVAILSPSASASAGVDHAAERLSNISLDSKRDEARSLVFPTAPGRFNPKTQKAPIDGKDVTKEYIETPFDEDKYEFKDLLPHFPDIKWAPLEYEDQEDVAFRADPTYRNLWKYVDEVEHLTPKFGSVLYGVDVAALDEKAQDELARFIAFRGTVFVRNQRNLDIKSQLKLGRRWGRLHRHATTGLPRGAAQDPDLYDVHVVYASPSRVPSLAFTQTNMWHSDVTYEKQPAAYTSLKLLEGPEHGGGDTLWSNGYALYDSLSKPLQEYLSKLTALHSAEEQANGAIKSGNTVRRDPIVTEHPLVRTNPVTGFNSIFVNPGFTRKIVGVPKAESDAILNLLFTELATNVINSVRWKWQKDDVAFWDNRSTAHSASFGFYPHARHAVRVTTHGETPSFSESGKSQQDTFDAELGITSYTKDVARAPVYND